MSEFSRLVAFIVANVSQTLCLLGILAMILGLAGGLRAVDEALLRQRKISQYGTIVRNLERRYKVARLSCIEQSSQWSQVRLEYYQGIEEDTIVSSQDLSLPGNDIYFDAMLINFSYSEIESGQRRNLALPIGVFSDKLAQADSLKLKIRDENGLPFIYARGDEDIYGIEPGEYRKSLSELMAIIDDPAKARRMGIVRSMYGNAVHRRLAKGSSYTVWIEQSGGLSIKDELDF